MLSCLIGVQGAALTWSAFLSRDALMIELTYDYWPSRFRARQKMLRPDLRTAVLSCEGVTSDGAFLYYSDHTHIKHNSIVTEELKYRVYEHSHQKLRNAYYPIGLPSSIWKLNDFKCNPKSFNSIVLG